MHVSRNLTAGIITTKILFYSSLVAYGFICAYPFLNMLAVSFSHPAYVVANKVFIFPIKFHLANYRILVQDTSYLRAYANTILYASVGTFSALFFFCSHRISAF